MSSYHLKNVKNNATNNSNKKNKRKINENKKAHEDLPKKNLLLEPKHNLLLEFLKEILFKI